MDPRPPRKKVRPRSPAASMSSISVGSGAEARASDDRAPEYEDATV
ncbi:hypothetical protein PI125_g20411 [Phytophthora idaei]|nr:hypothetical protein PI125_g20411 [Phytophthora idaei]KAG3133999.1 hypothetical protein PI126_g18897 [Phytophthora idaei]